MNETVVHWRCIARVEQYSYLAILFLKSRPVFHCCNCISLIPVSSPSLSANIRELASVHLSSHLASLRLCTIVWMIQRHSIVYPGYSKRCTSKEKKKKPKSVNVVHDACGASTRVIVRGCKPRRPDKQLAAASDACCGYRQFVIYDEINMMRADTTIGCPCPLLAIYCEINLSSRIFRHRWSSYRGISSKSLSGEARICHDCRRQSLKPELLESSKLHHAEGTILE